MYIASCLVKFMVFVIDLLVNMVRCNISGYDFSRRDSLNRHLKRKYPFKKTSRIAAGLRSSVSDIPTFDGSEFNGDQLIPRETLLKIMEMVSIPEDRREHIAREEEKKFHEDHKIDVSSEVLEPLELEEMKEDFQQLYADLKKSKTRENVPKLIDILNVWREAGKVSAEVHRVTLKKIKEI